MAHGRYRVFSDEERAERMKISQKKWRDKNRERIREYRAGYNAANRERVREYRREYYRANAEHAKELFIRILYGGKPEAWMRDHNVSNRVPEFVDELAAVVAALTDRLMTYDCFNIYIGLSKRKAAEPKGKRMKWKSTALAVLLQTVEAACMVSAIRYIKSDNNIDIHALIYDFCVINREHWPTDPDFLSNVARHVFTEVGVHVTFAAKPLEMDDKDNEWQQNVKMYTSMQTYGGLIPTKLNEAQKLMIRAVKLRSHFAESELFYHCFPDRLACTDNSSKWFYFQGPGWKHLGGNISHIIRVIDFDLTPMVGMFINKVASKEIKLDTKSSWKEDYDSLLMQALARLRSKTRLQISLRVFFKLTINCKWLSSMDSNPYILGLDDCVYDLAAREFRDGRPSEMVSMSCGHKLTDVEDYDMEIESRIYDTISGMFDDEEKFRYVWGRLSSCVSGRLPCDAFDIWTGRGRNGKGVIKALMASAFGNSGTGYYYEPDVFVFTSVRQNASGPSPELFKFKGKRCCMSSEGDAGDALQLALSKRLTGGDIIQARDLHKGLVSITPTFNLFLLFNVIPSVNDTSNTTKRCLRVNEFPMEYCDDPVEPNQKLIEPTLRDDFASKKYGATALGVMIRWFIENGHGAKPPTCVVEASRNFMLINDPMSEFMLSRYV
eukprot:jgi/Tetstr1/449681/TSEL_036749.t1